MYLLRLPNSVYYTRIATPLSLRESGYPNELKFSLLTRERKTAYRRNVEQVQLLHALFEKAIALSLTIVEFKTELAESINTLRAAYNAQPETQTKAPKLVVDPSPKIKIATTPSPGITTNTLTEFIQSKQLEGVTQLTLNQLEQRCNDFLGYLNELNADRPTNSIAMHYRDRLLKRKLSSKTLKDYIAANRQFFNWCLAHELITANPFAVVKTSSKNAKSAQEQRQRWKSEDLQKLFSNDAYRKQNTDFKWITLLMLYQGCRPSEACQLQVRDIKQGELPCIQFSDSGDAQKLKNQLSNRTVPIHQTLLDMGFLAFVKARQRAKETQLFNVTPRGADNDWSKDYRKTFGNILNDVGFKAGQRATAYSFRHTFIDELKRANVEEHVVSEIVGHKHQNMTYGRYGKRLEPEQLVEVVNLFRLDDIDITLSA
ncbi:tyrosine-type recombinase/integrase [Aliivibrio sp. S4TY2]|uniref:tyrosine-type recombinase/integrase n=1 Tax=unclassified Aliivibrio TaxID=2645654 RepID=UPI002377FF84|nr:MULTISPECIES: tyrosine-type recombinase/integrase [unclassified Aliivibrio]MDD9156708.1 tyrosine-type recombinase/integrase [Aliivibrio sp. S4TY2]MDD9160194.1 tyrosine-type recombinase/integrase [Aliivibrio sp. S4TY1]MDD9164514.1 tyrosine-type recombinase/integrase [Aliivibrio sp. S4MY2]MDD9168617.1 tyrosine-type recombinase/integrase [Aliivibrio sp. S4MY4]MDD9184848.1 tyrosine-type recombinase/integrase [Aliivibrio sp. S4MY3]